MLANAMGTDGANLRPCRGPLKDDDNYVSKFENQNVSFTEVAWLAANAFARSLRLPQLLICLQHIAVHDLKFAMTFRV